MNWFFEENGRYYEVHGLEEGTTYLFQLRSQLGIPHPSSFHTFLASDWTEFSVTTDDSIELFCIMR